MKHSLKITFIMLLLFLLSQIIGLGLLNLSIEQDAETGDYVYEDLPLGLERPEESSLNWIPIMLGILLGTALLLVLIRFKTFGLWRFWFSASVFFCLTFAIYVLLGITTAIILSLVLTYFKIFRPNLIVHNLTELLIYSGLAIIFVPILDLKAVTLLLIFISLYDIFAVWKSKHMVKLAQFQTNSKLFAGLLLPYEGNKIGWIGSSTKGEKTEPKKNNRTSKKLSSSRNAILGGGDIAFPLLFGGVVMKSLIDGKYFDLIPQASLFSSTIISKFGALLITQSIVVFSTLALAFLLFNSKKDKFYPAMPILSLGCFLGYFFISILI